MANDGFMFGCRHVPHDLTRRFNFTDANNAQAIRQNLAADGFVFLQKVLDESQVLAAREEVFSRLVEVGEIKPPAIAGIATGQSRRSEIADDLIEFWRSVSEGQALRKVTHGQQVRTIMKSVFGETARPQDYLWLRPRAAGWPTGLHYDHGRSNANGFWW